MKKYLFTVVLATVLSAFTLVIMLDTFLIERVYDTPEEEFDRALFVRAGTGDVGDAEGSAENSEDRSEADAPTDTQTGANEPRDGEASLPDGDGEGTVEPPFTAQKASGEDFYTDENIAIFLREERYFDTTVHIADVYLSSAEYLKTAFAKGKYGRNVKAATSETAEENGAILAVNGDFYGARERGYVLRNGTLYRSSSSGKEDLVIYPDGSFDVITEGETSADALKNGNAWQVLSFGPALVLDGEIAVNRNDEVGQAKASNPRTAVGIVDDLHYVFIVSDGRVEESDGLSLYELALILDSLGAQTAYNLDGGGSSTMYFMGRVVNTTTSGRSNDERSVSDIVYIG